MSEITDAVDEIIVRELGCDFDHVKPQARLIDDLLADSLDVVELAIEFEKKWNIEINDEETEAMRTVGDCHALIEQKAVALREGGDGTTRLFR